MGLVCGSILSSAMALKSMSKVPSFFVFVDPKDKDFGRRWKMKDWFNDDEEKENPTIK